MRKIVAGIAILVILCAVSAIAEQQQTTAQPAAPAEANSYVGTQVCAGCHKPLYEKWLLTPHRRTLTEGRDPSKTGCESCHGPGGAHVAGGGDVTKIIKLADASTRQVTETCLKCHKQPDVILFRTGTHSAMKIKCSDCHDVHYSGLPKMLREVESKQYSIRGLTEAIQEKRLEANIASKQADKDKALAELNKLEAKKADLEAKLFSPETRGRRQTESELCLSCHKEQRAQFSLNTHHPVPEDRMQCSSCHNPHGGQKSNLREESVNETCFKCHAEFAGPYVFEHSPVEEDCTNCHKPHGSAQNFLLKQSLPFLCLKCHVAPHTGASLTNPGTNFGTGLGPRYTDCTTCHSRPHGSDRHAALFY